jgi:hypothetical protein
MRVDQRGAAFPGASDFQALFPCDPVEPGFDGGVSTEARHPFKGRQKDLLGNLLGQLLIEQMAPAVTDHGILIVLNQDTQSSCVLPLG